MNVIFKTYHDLIGQANELIKQLPVDLSDEHMRAKQSHVLNSLIDAQKNALQLETAMTSARTFPRK